MKRLRKTIYWILVVVLLIPSSALAAGEKYTYSDWSAWQAVPVSPSDTVEVETRTVEDTAAKTAYTYEYWRYWNSAAGKYLYKGNGNLGGTYYSVTLDSKLKFYTNTSDGAAYLVGGGRHINFDRELWYNQREVVTTVVTGQRTEYRSRTKTIVKDNAAPVKVKPAPAPVKPAPAPKKPVSTPAAGAVTGGDNFSKPPGAIGNIKISKTSYLEGENIVISWSGAANASKYGLTVRKSPYAGDSSIVYNNRISGTSVNIGTLKAGNYRFAMRAYNSAGDAGPVSSIIYFTVSRATIPNADKQKNQNPILPVDINAGAWTASTYNGTGGHWGTAYRAIDLNMLNDKEAGLPVKAVANGKIVKIHPNYGEVHIEHTVPLILNDGSRTYHTWYTVYAHMNIAAGLKEGDVIEQGTIIGNISNVSPAKINIHLHFAITTRLDGGKYVSKAEVFNMDTISPRWLGGDYLKLVYTPYGSRLYDSTSIAPASN
ncbi:MAG: peptidoglycan DD-metalloendopeptidase family protein [Firmicutes bacterium]|nr:peptidoglycan DD-metalloendopeptidase family protein [Bacillota bacterium]